ncbi:MAG: sulfatase-like hydrolase/transferase, partial [Pseudomonadota bacterium]
MREVWITAAAALLLVGCGENAPEEHAQGYDFGGVFDDTYAGEVDRVVTPRRPDGPPNVVLIIADDLGWPYLGFLGDENVITPNMDILGRGGAVFERGHATANHCRPTLQSLITGLHPVQYENQALSIADQKMASNPIPDEIETEQDRNVLRRQYETGAIEEFATLPRVLAEEGYASHQSGKWWEQSYKHGGFTNGMTGSWSWEDAVGLGDKWFFTFMGGSGMEIGRETMVPVTDFIEEHADQPFFVWYGPALPHTPLNAPDRFYKYYENRDDLSESAKLYYANIAWFDWGVGKLLDALREQRVLDNTLIIYVNDNGWEQPPGVEYSDNPITFANGGPRGKGSFFETAFRTPIIFYWQGMITALRDTSTLASAIDVMPTILDYAGVESPEGLPG